METANAIIVEASIQAPLEKIWEFWTNPDHIVKWNHASDDWHTPWAENDLRTGGKFLSRMEAKDGSIGFDFEGIYSRIKEEELIEYSLSDGRKVKVEFIAREGITEVREVFEPEKTNPEEMQKAGWQAILNNFKKYSESH